MKPQITAVQGSAPSGMEQPSSDPRGPQSVRVAGTGFANGMVLFVDGPNGRQAIHQPSIQGISDAECYAVIDLPVAGGYQILVALAPEPGQAPQHSDWFSFTVK